MAKQKKKRTKKYSGTDAVARPAIVRVSAVDRSRLGQWWFDHKRIARPILIAIGIAAALAFCIVGIIHVV